MWKGPIHEPLEYPGKMSLETTSRLRLVFASRRENRKRSPERLVPQVKAGHGVQAHVFVSPAGTLQAAVDGFPPLAAQAAERARPFGDVVFEQVDAGVALLPQLGRGRVRQARRLLVVVGHHLVQAGVGGGGLLQGGASCGPRRL